MERTPSPRRSSYTAGFKLKVIKCAEEHNNSFAAREFSINESVIRSWRKKKPELNSTPKCKKALRFKKTPFGKLEDTLFVWISELRQNGIIVSRMAIRTKALELFKTPDYHFDVTFKASSGWCNRFMNRKGLVLRQKTHIAQKLPSDLDEKLTNFHSYVIDSRKKMCFSLGQIGNMDETPMFFDLPSNKTIHFAGEKCVTVRTTGAEKQHFTVVLACLADGTKLKPMVIFKRKTFPKEKFPKGIIVKVHPKGWMDEKLTEVWVDEVWQSRPGGLLKPPSLLVWDQFRAHKTDHIKKHLKNVRTTQAVIPGGCTSILQPLDVCLNKPFKGHIRKMWTDWMISGEKSYTPGGAMRRPTLSLITEWVKVAWDAIPKDMVQKSFKKCGISNSLDGEEDDALFSDFVGDTESQADDETGLTDDEMTDLYDADPNLNDDIIREIFQSDDEEEEFLGF